MSYQEDFFDPTKRAKKTLQYVIADQLENDPEQRKQPQAAVQAELTSRPILDNDTGRTESRVLFLTTDESYLEPKSLATEAMRTRSRYFDELHIMVLRTGKPLRNPVIRIGPRVWVYDVTAEHWWWTPFVAKKFAARHLSFAGVFRPDLIVGLDPYEAGFAAYRIARAYQLPFQIHINKDRYNEQFFNATSANHWRERLARHVLHRTKSVRTATAETAERITLQYPKIPDVQALPSFFDVQSILDATPQFSLHEKYPGWKFIMLYVGPLTKKSKCFQAIDAARFALKSPGIGLIILGDGPAREEFAKRAKLLHIEESIAFVPHTNDPVSFYKGANVCLVPEVTEAADQRVLTMAAAGLPVIAAETDLRTDLFVTGEQIFLHEADDVTAMTRHINTLLNDVTLRKRFAREARDAVADRLVQNPDQYQRAYRDSLETAIFV